VRREIPEYVDLLLVNPEVHAQRADILNFPSSPDSMYSRIRRTAALYANVWPAIRVRRCSRAKTTKWSPRHADSEWFLHEHVFTGKDRPACERVVCAGWCRHDHCVNRAILQNSFCIGRENHAG